MIEVDESLEHGLGDPLYRADGFTQRGALIRSDIKTRYRGNHFAIDLLTSPCFIGVNRNLVFKYMY